MRAREPDNRGYAVNDGVRIYYEVHGDGRPTIVLMPTWALVHSRAWKMQIPYLARHFRVVTFDPRGNGRTDRPDTCAAYDDDAYLADTLAVMAATETEQAVLVAHCRGTAWAAHFAVDHPDRVLGVVAINTNLPLGPPDPERASAAPFDERLERYEGWDKDNRHYWSTHWPDYVDFFADRMSPEPHSTKVLEDTTTWGRQTDGPTMTLTVDAHARTGTSEAAADLAAEVPCPVLVVCGDQDRITPCERSVRLAELTGGDLLHLEGSGHLPHVRHPVVVNRAIREFVERVSGPTRPRNVWLFARQRPRRALWVSSPIGLGHVLRDVAIARALRERVPDLEIEWLSQPPVTDVLKAAGEVVHDASADLASESAHWEGEASAHELHAFDAFRRMDEILCANYMLFDDVVRETPYDLWVGDEAWEVDHFLHENPERKIAPFVFITDVVGFLPVDPEDPHELALTADYNAEMIEHRERHPRLRDLSLFIGSAAEIPDASFGPGLPEVRAWTTRWFDEVPYVVPFDPRAYRDPGRLRRELGYGEGYPLLTAAVGGTAVGTDLLELVAEGFARLRQERPEVRMTMVTGPRISPDALPDVEGLDKHGYLPDAFAHLAASDAAVVQGGLSTTMELVAARRPFLYFPLARHWEQQHFVTHRLRHYRAGTRMDFATTTPADLAAAMTSALERRPRYRAVPRDGAAVAADRIAGLLRR